MAWDKDGKSLVLSGMDRTGFVFSYTGVQPGKYTLRLNAPSGEGLTEAVTFEIAGKP